MPINDEQEGQAISGMPLKCRKISPSETSPVGVAMNIACSPLSATARRLLLSKIHIGEPSPSYVDESSLWAHSEYPEQYVEHNLEEQWIVISK